MVKSNSAYPKTKDADIFMSFKWLIILMKPSLKSKFLTQIQTPPKKQPEQIKPLPPTQVSNVITRLEQRIENKQSESVS
jgi:hypothetical protein